MERRGLRTVELMKIKGRGTWKRMRRRGWRVKGRGRGRVRRSEKKVRGSDVS